MDTIIKSVVEQTVSFSSSADIIRCIPHFVAAAQSLTVPGVEKREIVLKALHSVIEALVESGKVSKESKDEIHGIIDLVAPVAIDAILDVARGKVPFTSSAAPAAPAAPAASSDTSTSNNSKASVAEVAGKGIQCMLSIFKIISKKK
jgi:hypothetical protein